MATAQPEPELRLQHVQKIWDRGLHNAFTDLCYFNEQYWLVFREASEHVSADGTIIVLSSKDSKEWKQVASLSLADYDLRDPKIITTPDNRLLITCGGAKHTLEGRPLQSFVVYSNDGSEWSDPKPVGDIGQWLWRTRFINNDGYGVAYDPGAQSTTLYKLVSNEYLPWVDPLFSKATQGLGYPNEHDLFQLPDGRMACLLRRDADTATAQLGTAKSPYRDWQWQDLGIRIGGPVAIPITTLSAGFAILSAVRLYEPARTALCWLNVEDNTLTEALVLPSGGDTSYAGLVQNENKILCSYYSSHEEKSSIYLAEIELGG